MIFATLKEVLERARAGKYAVGAFNINDNGNRKSYWRGR